MSQPDTILVIDFGGQYTQLIARRVRDLSVYSEILPHTAIQIGEFKPKGVILSGGPQSVYEEASPALSDDILTYCRENQVPILGICYGLQLIGQSF